MKTFAVTYCGLYPVGACLIVTTDKSEEDMKLMLIGWFVQNGLEDGNLENGGLSKAVEIREIDTTFENIQVILNGDY